MVKELVENTLQVRSIAPGNFHLQGRSMDRFLYKITEAAGMEDFTIPISLDPQNSETSPISAKHPLGGRKKARDENGFLGWRDSWVSACVYNGTRTEEGVQVTVTAHACGSLPTDKILRVIYTATHPSRMQWGMLSSAEETSGFTNYELVGDRHFKEIVHLLWQTPRTINKKIELGQLLEKEVLARKMLRRKLSGDGISLEQLDRLLLKDELRKLQRLFGTYEGILEQEAAERITTGGADLDCFPYFERYNQLTDSEISGTQMLDGIRRVCMVGGGWLPISAILYALKTDVPDIFVVEKDPERAETAKQVIDSLNLGSRITIMNQKAEFLDYTNMDVVVVAAIAEPKHKILAKASETNFPRTIVLRGPLGDNKALYPSFTTEELFGRIGKLHHYPIRHDVQPESDGIFALLYLDSERVVNFP